MKEDAVSEPRLSEHPCPECNGEPRDPDCAICGGAGTLVDATPIVRAMSRPAPADRSAEDRERIWSCEIGGPAGTLPPGADLPMRQAVREAYRQVTGAEDEYLSSGWARMAALSRSAGHADRSAEDGLRDFRRWVFNECGITAEGAWTEEFDRRLLAALSPSAGRDGLREVQPCTQTHARGTTHYHVLRPRRTP